MTTGYLIPLLFTCCKISEMRRGDHRTEAKFVRFPNGGIFWVGEQLVQLLVLKWAQGEGMGLTGSLYRSTRKRVKGIRRLWLSCFLFIFGIRRLRPAESLDPSLGMEGRSLYLCFFEITSDLVQNTVESQKYVRHEEGHWRGIKQYIEMNNSKCLVTLKLQVHRPNRKSASLNVFKRALTQE